MHNASTPSHANTILVIIRAMLDNVSAHVEVSDANLLESISTAAAQIAQDLRVTHDALLAQIDEHEALMADKLMAESDALDHQIANLV